MPDDALHDALCFHLLVIGEVVKHLDPETSRHAPEVQWQRIAGLRDVIVHDSQNDHDGFDIFGAGGASRTGETGSGLAGPPRRRRNARAKRWNQGLT